MNITIENIKILKPLAILFHNLFYINMQCRFNSFSLPFKASISDKDLDSLQTAEQYFSDCYICSSMDTLSKTENGRKILKEKLQYDDTNPELINCYLHNNTELEKYTIPTSEAVAGYESVYEHQPNKLLRSMDISVAEYENKHKAKYWICRVSDKFKTFSFENSLPSHFMKTVTGIEPTYNIAETDLNINLKSYKKEVLELFEKMDKDKEHSFVIGSGIKRVDGKRFHVYVLEDVDLENNSVTIKNKRGNVVRTMSVDEALENFKYIVGYFNSDLAKKS